MCTSKESCKNVSLCIALDTASENMVLAPPLICNGKYSLSWNKSSMLTLFLVTKHAESVALLYCYGSVHEFWNNFSNILIKT